MSEAEERRENVADKRKRSCICTYYDAVVEDEYQQGQFQSAFERVSLTGI